MLSARPRLGSLCSELTPPPPPPPSWNEQARNKIRNEVGGREPADRDPPPPLPPRAGPPEEIHQQGWEHRGCGPDAAGHGVWSRCEGEPLGSPARGPRAGCRSVKIGCLGVPGLGRPSTAPPPCSAEAGQARGQRSTDRHPVCPALLRSPLRAGSAGGFPGTGRTHARPRGKETSLLVQTPPPSCQTQALGAQAARLYPNCSPPSQTRSP